MTDFRASYNEEDRRFSNSISGGETGTAKLACKGVSEFCQSGSLKASQTADFRLLLGELVNDDVLLWHHLTFNLNRREDLMANACDP